MRNLNTGTVLLIALLASVRVSSAQQECQPWNGFSFICGPVAVEDLVPVPDTKWIIGGGMVENRNPGKLHLINGVDKTLEILYPGPNPQNDPDLKSYPACPGAPDAKRFGAHGIAVHPDGRQSATILAVNHGREAIEVFKLSTSGSKPAIRWVGCVSTGENNYVNSVAFLPGGGFVATKFFDPKAPGGFASIFAGKPTGGVLEWHPETGIKPLAGTEVAGANGIEVSRDGKWIYVAAWGSQEIARLSRGKDRLQKDVIRIGFCPDNLRWSPDGKLLVAGQNPIPGSAGGFPKFKGWTVGKLDPETLKFTELAKDSGESPMQNVSVAIEANGALWLGQFAGDRIGYRK